MFEEYLPYLYGAFGGVIWALMGLVYNKTGNPDFSFSFFNFIKTVIIGVAFGGASSYFGQPIDVFATTAWAASITAFIDRFLNIIIKKVTS